jgi:hypothetical protein
MPEPFKQAYIVTTESGRAFRVVTKGETFEAGRDSAKHQAAFTADSPAWDSCTLPWYDDAKMPYGLKELKT